MSHEIATRLGDEFARHFGASEDICVARAPGRVNLLGEHTDYNDGFVLPMTIDRAVWLALRPRRDDRVVLFSLTFDEAIDYPLANRPAFAAGAWSSYVSGTVEELRSRGLLAMGFEGVVFGDVPLGAGLSSSAALEVATLVSLQHLFHFEIDAIDAALLCQQVEHRYVGVQCGIMDQFAARLGRENHALFLDCRSRAYEHIPLRLDKADVEVVIVHSGVQRALAASKYNERRAECEQGLAVLREFDSSLSALRDVSDELFENRHALLPGVVSNRCRHVIEENRRVLEASERLRHDELAEFGSLMNDSHASLRDLYEVSCPQLDALVSIAQGTPGVLGARMTGAGFGGCTVQLVERSAVHEFSERIAQLYPRRFDLKPTIFSLGRNLSAGPHRWVPIGGSLENNNG